MPSSSVPELQQKLFRRMGIDVPDAGQSRRAFSGKRVSKTLSRKDERKAHRAEKRSQRHPKPQRLPNGGPQGNGRSTPAPSRAQPQRPNWSTLERRDEDDVCLSDDEAELQEGSGEGSSEGDDDASGSPIAAESTTRRDGLSTAVQDKLAQDDAEIEDFERKLGIKKGRKSLPKAFKDDGLEDLVDSLGAQPSASDDDDSNKRKRDYDEWLSSKRRKADLGPNGGVASRGDASRINGKGFSRCADSEEDGAEFEDEVSLCESETEGIYSDTSDDTFDGFNSEPQAGLGSDARPRENPYVAPATGTVAAKYIPPSLRKASGSDDEARRSLRKQVQGQINRLTDSNILSIVDAIEKVYQRNARGDVTEVLTDAIMAQICKAESLPDQFFVLAGGLASAVYKIIGASFGSHLVRRLVGDFGREYDKATCEANSGSAVIQKEASNIISFLTQLYAFGVITCRLLFGYMERLLSSLSEMNVELLLRVCRMVGRLLRKDDPQAVRHVSESLSKSVAKAGYANVSVRTKFMLETINDLRNNKPKAKGVDSDVLSEHLLRMRKRLGELKSQSRRLDGISPMGMSLEDVEGADTHGSWWLVGASVPAYREAAGRAKDIAKERQEQVGGSLDDEDMDFVLPDYPKKARAQGLGTTAQIAIFTSLLSAHSHEHGYQQFIDLKLKKDEQLEIARVLVQCVGSEAQYNEYYAMVGRLACQNGRVRFALQDRLWKIFRSLGESLFGDDADEEETAEGERMNDERRVGNVARFYASLVTDGALSIAILKPLELPKLNRRASSFVERFLVSLLQHCRDKDAQEGANVQRVFGPAREVTALAAGIHWFLRKKIRKSKLIGTREGKRLDRVREEAQAVVQGVDADGAAPA